MEVKPPDSGPDAPEPVREIDPMKLQMLMQQLRDNQSLSMGMLGGTLAATVGACVWAAITAGFNIQIGFMAIGIGFLVGYAIRRFGDGVDNSFAILGGALSLFGCLLGNYLSVCAMVAQAENLGLMEVLTVVDIETAFELMKEQFDVMDLFFYGLAVYYGYRNSVRPLSPEEQASVLR